MKKIASATIDENASVHISASRIGELRVEWVRTDNTISYVTRVKLSHEGARRTLASLQEAFNIIDGKAG